MFLAPLIGRDQHLRECSGRFIMSMCLLSLFLCLFFCWEVAVSFPALHSLPSPWAGWLAGFFIVHCPFCIHPQTEQNPVFLVAPFPGSAKENMRDEEGLRWGGVLGLRAWALALQSPLDSRCASITSPHLPHLRGGQGLLPFSSLAPGGQKLFSWFLLS